MSRQIYDNIDDYIAACQPSVQPILQELREFIKKHAPEASEKISWSMPTFYLSGNLIHFAAAKKHIGLYPGASGIENFIADFEKLGLKYSKGAVQFPLGKPLPWELIQRIVEFRVKENRGNS
ncbi:MAG: iron chaperone [Anaerovoracaceae bacterium]